MSVCNECTDVCVWRGRGGARGVPGDEQACCSSPPGLSLLLSACLPANDRYQNPENIHNQTSLCEDVLISYPYPHLHPLFYRN